MGARTPENQGLRRSGEEGGLGSSRDIQSALSLPLCSIMALGGGGGGRGMIPTHIGESDLH